LASACSRIVRMEEFSCTTSLGRFVQTTLLEASQHPDPEHHPEHDARYDEHLAWGSPAVRVAAAEGVVLLARHPTCAAPEVLQTIERLSIDPVPPVRFQIAARLNALYSTAPDCMWRIIEHLSHDEPSRGVLQELLSGPLGRLAGVHLDH